MKTSSFWREDHALWRAPQYAVTDDFLPAAQLPLLLLSNWRFLYLTQARHLSITQSGCLAMAPPLAAALGGAVAALAACFGFVELTEASFFGAAMVTARGNTMTVSAIVKAIEDEDGKSTWIPVFRMPLSAP
jgi:hypothetical protein